MILTDNVKAKIDAMDYPTMLGRWRFAPVGDQTFQGESGDYFCTRMAEKRKEVGEAGHTATSKQIGWT